VKVLAKLIDRDGTPVLKLSIFGAPHRRVQVEVLHSYRDALRRACIEASIDFPIKRPVEIEVIFVDPSSPDLGNLYLALEQAMDGKSLLGVGILADDSLVQKVSMSKFFPVSLERTAEERAMGRQIFLPKYSVMDEALT
jgi:hypothetical protein